ncbi:MAG: hypothetical protein M1830_001275 [Pleopsidium flavum]|nr:MAG: hypothetical protein M1830_001275 [Pleopsidium flavum]
MPVNSEELMIAESEGGLTRAKSKRHRLPFHQKGKVGNADITNDNTSDKEQSPSKRKSPDTQYGSSPSDRNTTGTPFLRAPSRRRRSISSGRESGVSQTDGAAAGSEDARSGRSLTRPMFGRFRSDRSESCDSDGGSRTRSDSPSHSFLARHKEKEPRKAYVPVGISRLHLVEMPSLQMKPIYWSPVHDVSSVVRGTWFYKGTMLPVESEVAYQLEDGYTYNKPWTQTWQDELNSCVEAGAEGEAKAVHRLWPQNKQGMPAGRLATGEGSSSNQFANSQSLETTAASTRTENEAAGSNATEIDTDPPKKFANSSVIYVNSREAQILQPSLLPSPTRGRTPLALIRKGRQIGVVVVRGFDYKAWEKLHPPTKSPTASKALEGAAVSQSGATATGDRRKLCGACLIEEERPKVTDLVLVIHGIGQKLSERVESFHFTHAINAFRRQINVELGTEAIKTYLRDDLGGIMVLPINWRSTLTFDDGTAVQPGKGEGEDLADNQFTLKDITPESIPAIRNLISDVMLDIPYYLSHHKPKMIQAVIKEANRVYRLWCRNNPGFEQTGKVHLIAHSLGSVMALDILSKQPTQLPKQLDLKSKKVHDNMFEFDTKSLFLCGSPAGFFLLLNKATLLPRKWREKADTDGNNNGGGVAGDAGTYGCLAVDNLYNIMHYNDPIAYRVNAAVDTDYAASLQPASVPSLNSTFFQSIGNLFRGTAPTTTPTTQAATAALNLDPNAKRPTVTKLPSTIEMETHNFTREEIAEKRMYLLNENGQIDYYLSSGGGPLEIQYLNMLGAHSSYWVLGDFVRLVVLEVGRRGGRENTLVAMRAVKRGFKK